MFRILISALTILHLGPGIAFAVLAFGCDPADPVAGALCQKDTIGTFIGITLTVWVLCLLGWGVMRLVRGAPMAEGDA